MIYLDHNATTPPRPEVVDAMLPYLRERYGNPSSVHRVGRLARAALDRAREQVAELVNAHPDQVLFTSGGTEANNLALSGIAARLPGRRLVVGATEHPSVLEAAAGLTRRGWQVTKAPVDRDGVIDLAAVDRGLTGTTLVSVMWANNETGVLQPVAALADRIRERGGLFHCDAVQAVGKVAVDFPASGVHALTLSAHKINGPQGSGALVVDKRLDIEPLLVGGGQERGLRSGTENLPAVVGFGVAASLARREREQAHAATRALTERLLAGLDRLPGATVFGRAALRLPNTVMLALPGYDGEALLMALDHAGIAVSSGSACHSASGLPSHVLQAMGIEPELARGAIRVSCGRGNSAAEIDRLLELLGRLAVTAGGWAAVG